GGRAAWAGAAGLVAVVAVLGYLPYLVSRGTQVDLVGLFALVVLGTMWNLLAGYGGMVSIGQQAYIGIGGYGLVYLAEVLGVDPFLAVPVAAVVCALVAWPTSYLAFRLSGGYFAIGTWVIAEVVRLLVTQVDAVGAGSGASLTAFSGIEPLYRIAFVYWMSLGIAVAVVVGVYLLMRSRVGLALTAIRDDPTAASSAGVAVTRAKRLVYVVAAAGCGLAGAMIVANTLRVQPGSIFSVEYSAVMVFIVVIGGIGTIEGPVLGALVFYLLQDSLADLGNWYLVVVGTVAVAVTLLAPTGLWGLTRGRVELFPTGYRVLR
ncbi:MAG TPA: branched-chain amino acid ABC transporter permease, partial [Geodermatophilus sp.]|nr:branched-chain amino acid ABC transporter permease [Geodermatophilus sp.]